MTQKSVLITGCSAGGIGDALAQCFHKHGYYVFATARNLSKIEHLKEHGMTVLALDVQDPESIANAVDSVRDITGGKLDVLVNNSGGGLTMPVLDVDIDAAKNMYDVNLWGVLRTIQAFAPLLITARGTIVNVGSSAGEVGVPFGSMYSSSKAAVNMMTDILRMEMKPLGVKVILLVAAAVKSNFAANLPAVALPENSVYQIAKSAVEKGMGPVGERAKAISGEEFAEITVRNVMKANPTKRQWAGGSSGTMWIMTTFLWRTFPDMIFPKMFGLLEVEKAWSSKSKST